LPDVIVEATALLYSGVLVTCNVEDFSLYMIRVSIFGIYWNGFFKNKLKMFLPHW